MLTRVAARMLPLLPQWLVAPVARRYLAGETRAEALECVASLVARGLEVTADLLGENVRSSEEAAEVTAEYLALTAAFAERGWAPHLSVKLTHLGLRVAEELALENARRLVESAAGREGFVFLDMEDSSTTDGTLRIYRALRGGSPRVGMAIQAVLRRSAADVGALLDLSPVIRICKGIYREPADRVHRGARRVRERFMDLVRQVLAGGGVAAVATHDTALLEATERLVKAQGVSPERYELQMLLGVRERLWPVLRGRGHRLRIYCPYGPDWYDYSLRRLRENPHLVRHVLRGALSRR